MITKLSKLEHCFCPLACETLCFCNSIMDTKIQESKMVFFNTKTHLITVKDLRVNISIHKIINVLLIDIAILWDQQTMYG